MRIFSAVTCFAVGCLISASVSLFGGEEPAETGISVPEGKKLIYRISTFAGWDLEEIKKTPRNSSGPGLDGPQALERTRVETDSDKADKEFQENLQKTQEILNSREQNLEGRTWTGVDWMYGNFCEPLAVEVDCEFEIGEITDTEINVRVTPAFRMITYWDTEGTAWKIHFKKNTVDRSIANKLQGLKFLRSQADKDHISMEAVDEQLLGVVLALLHRKTFSFKVNREDNSISFGTFRDFLKQVLGDGYIEEIVPLVRKEAEKWAGFVFPRIPRDTKAGDTWFNGKFVYKVAAQYKDGSKIKGMYKDRESAEGEQPEVRDSLVTDLISVKNNVVNKREIDCKIKSEISSEQSVQKKNMYWWIKGELVSLME